MSTLTTKITESVTLNGKTFGNEITKTHASIQTAKQTVVEVGTGSFMELFDFAASRTGIGTAQDAKSQYIRITNLDASNFIVINVYLDLATDEYIAFKIPAGGCFLLCEDKMEGGGTATTTLDQIDAINAQADTATVQVEVFIAEIA
jgi:hypothetical protein